MELRCDLVLESSGARGVFRVIDAVARAIAGGTARVARAGTWRTTQSSKVAVSPALPGEAGNVVGSSVGTRSMTVRRGSVVVPWRGQKPPLPPPPNTTPPP